MVQIFGRDSAHDDSDEHDSDKAPSDVPSSQFQARSRIGFCVVFGAISHLHLTLKNSLKHHISSIAACSIAEKRHIGSTTTILDMQGLGLKNFSMTAANLVACMAKIDSSYYPETLHRMFIVNVGSGFKMLFGTPKKYAGIVTVEGITDVLEVRASLFIEGIVVVHDSIFV
ncbi:hypothetical protein Syun_004424 [Stephania yunnanensis]|uniref:CRAL-TRIO domain-containing protein n=1 Tax=Stephania yunnanensis TaxID=152371 RepID=A0AAP0Q0S7_9MAGN